VFPFGKGKSFKEGEESNPEQQHQLKREKTVQSIKTLLSRVGTEETIPQAFQQSTKFKTPRRTTFLSSKVKSTGTTVRNTKFLDKFMK
jgi:hypothetical protein